LVVGADYGRVYLSTDGGATWIRRRVEHGASTQTIHALHIVTNPLSTKPSVAGTSNGIWTNYDISSGDWEIDPDWTAGGTVSSGCRDVSAIVVDPDEITYAGTNCGLFTLDRRQADHWQQIAGPAGPLVPGPVNAIVVDPELADTAYVATNDGVRRVTDGGGTTTPISYNGLTDRAVRALAIDPVDGSLLYAGSATQGVFKGNPDGAGAWTPFSSGLAGQGIAALAVSPADPRRLYAVTATGDVYGIEQSHLPTAPHDLAVSYSTPPQPGVKLSVNRGTFSGTATVRSQGPAGAANIRFALDFQKPNGLRIANAWGDVTVTRLQASRGSCSIGASRATCSLGTLAPGAIATVTFWVEPKASAANVTLTTVAGASGTTAGDLWGGVGDRAAGNNSARATTSVRR
jgi:hypothetical protein